MSFEQYSGRIVRLCWAEKGCQFQGWHGYTLRSPIPLACFHSLGGTP